MIVVVSYAKGWNKKVAGMDRSISSLKKQNFKTTTYGALSDPEKTFTFDFPPASLRKLREQRVLCFSIFYSQLHTLCSMVVVQFWQVITQHHWNLQLQSSYLVSVFVSYSRWQHMLSQFSGRSVGAVALQFLSVLSCLFSVRRPV